MLRSIAMGEIGLKIFMAGVTAALIVALINITHISVPQITYNMSVVSELICISCFSGAFIMLLLGDPGCGR